MLAGLDVYIEPLGKTNETKMIKSDKNHVMFASFCFYSTTW